MSIFYKNKGGLTNVSPKNKKQFGQYLSEREVLLSAEKPSFS